MKPKEAAEPTTPATADSGQREEPSATDEVTKARQRDEKLKQKLEKLRKSDPFVYPLF